MLAWTILGIAVAGVLIYDLIQRKHTILRNYPLIGHFRYIAEFLGKFFRAFFSATDTEERPFDRRDRTWVYRAAKDADTTIGFGSTRDPSPVGSIYFSASSFPVLNRDATETKALVIGEDSPNPYLAKSIINISAMSYGAISRKAILALGGGAKKAGCWYNTGEGGLSPYHLESGCDIVAQIGTAKFGYRNEDGSLSDEKLKKAASHSQVKMFEIKLSQGAKPGKGGMLPGKKVTPEIAEIRGVPVFTDVHSPNRFPEISNVDELLDFIHHVKEVTQKPTGIKFVLGEMRWFDDLFQAIKKRDRKYWPHFITLDGAEGGTGASPMSLVDYMGYPIAESLPKLVDKLNEYGLRKHIRVIASGKLITADKVAWALATGADFINSARGFLFALGCIQSLQCSQDTCPTGIATHNPWLEHGLVVKTKIDRVYHYVKTMEKEVGIICHSSGVHEPRELTRAHVRMVCENGKSISLEELYPSVKDIGNH